MSKFYEEMAKGISGVISFGLYVALLRVIGIAISWSTGWIIEKICGDYMASGLNLLFGTTRFTASSLPMLTIALGLIGSYFAVKYNEYNKNK